VHLAAAARGLAACGDFLAATALALALQASGAGGMAVSGLLLASALPLVLLAPVAGRVADRVDSRLLLVATGLGQAAVCAVLAYTEQPVAIIALVALIAAGLAVSSPTLTALVPDMVGRDDLPKATALMQTANAAGVLAGPALAGVLVGQFGVRVPLLLDAASYLGFAVAALVIRTRRGGRAMAGTADTADTHDVPAWSLRADRLLFALIVAVGATVAGIAAVNVADVFFVRETLGASEAAYGLIGAVWTSGLLAGAWVSTRLIRSVVDGTVALGIVALLAGVSVVLLTSATVPTVWWLYPLWILGGLANGGLNVGINVLIPRRVPAAVRGRALGLLVGVVNAANVCGFLLGGALLERFSVRPVIAGAGLAGVLAVAATAVPVLQAVRREAGAELAAGSLATSEPAAQAQG
jgi:MFS family permease